MARGQGVARIVILAEYRNLSFPAKDTRNKGPKIFERCDFVFLESLLKESLRDVCSLALQHQGHNPSLRVRTTGMQQQRSLALPRAHHTNRPKTLRGDICEGKAYFRVWGRCRPRVRGENWGGNLK